VPCVAGAPAMSMQPENTPPSKTSFMGTTLRWLTNFSYEVWQVLKTMIVIHHNVPEAEPLLPPEQYAYTKINTQTQVAQAQWAALYRQPQLYQASLTQAIAWIQRYYAAGDATNAILKQLQNLTKINVKPPAPNSLRSVQAIQHAMIQSS